MKVSGSWQKKIVTDNPKTQLKYPKWFEIKYLTVTMTSVFPVHVEWLPLRCLITNNAFVWPKIYIPEFPSCAILLFPQTANCLSSRGTCLTTWLLTEIQKKKNFLLLCHCSFINPNADIFLSSLLYAVLKPACMNPEEFLLWNMRACWAMCSCCTIFSRAVIPQ